MPRTGVREAVVIGAGIAGAATAYHLAATGRWRVTVLEKEPVAGFHATGRNAAMIRQAVLPDAVAALAVDATRALHAMNSDERLGLNGVFRRTGSILWGERTELERLLAAPAAPKDARILARADLSERFPKWPLPPGDAGLWTPSDGVIDVARLLHFFLHAQENVVVRCGEEVIGAESGERAFGRVRTDVAAYEADSVVNAAGAWADRIAERLGGSPEGLTPRRRHLFWSGALDWVDLDRPYTWDITRGFYYRPESHGLLACACDEDVSLPVDASADPSVARLLAEKFAVFPPPMSDLPVARSWAGLRTFADDHSFVIGKDVRRRGLFWNAALGGHGVTVADAVGRLVAGAVDRDLPVPAAFAPGRTGPSHGIDPRGLR